MESGRRKKHLAFAQSLASRDPSVASHGLHNAEGRHRRKRRARQGWWHTHKLMRRLFSDLHSWITSSSSRSSSRVKLSLSSTSCSWDGEESDRREE